MQHDHQTCKHHATKTIPSTTPVMPGAQYTCPMHPEIIKNEPGHCPKCGMALEPMIGSTPTMTNHELKYMTVRFWISVVLTLPLFFIHSSWMQFLFSTPVTIWGGWPFFMRAWASIKHKQLTMFTLIGMGTSIAYVYSLIGLFFPQYFPSQFRHANGEVNLYFEAAATITVLVLLGQVLELRGRERTSSAIKALLNLTPKTARLLREDGQVEEIALEKIQVNDRLHVRPGEKIPVDGEIIEGNSHIDESMVTGESMPVEKTIGATVIAGTLNTTGSFVLRAKRVGSNTMLSQIIQLVGLAQRSRVPIQRLADSVASYFVPTVIIVAMITFFTWLLLGPAPSAEYGLISAVSVLIIACPCALGLATPMSIMVGIGRGAQLGILIKNAQALERFEKIDTLVIDKTGTLTVGKPALAHLIACPEFTEAQLLQFAASLERNSEHPLANAIVTAAKARGLSLLAVEQFYAETGKGIRGTVAQKTVILGNQQILTALTISPDTALLTEAEKLRHEGETVMFMVIDHQLAGLISVADSIKSTTPAALQALREKNIRIVMLTGDHRITAETIAKKLAIDAVEAEVLPQEKNAVIQRLQQQGRKVAMAGDGIIYGPALAQADVGIAMGTGADVAIESASVTLVKGDLLGVVRALQLSRKTMQNIRQNLWLAFLYNTLCIPIAAGVLYPWTGILLSPMIGAAAMSLSSVSVIINALRLRSVAIAD